MNNFKRFKLIFIYVIFCALLSFSSTAQDSTQYRIETNDGNSYIGYITFEDSNNIKLQVIGLGELTISVSDITRRTVIDTTKIVAGKYWFDNPQASRYFWIPNGYSLNKGEGYYQNVWIFFNQFAVGVSDNISIGGGLMPIFLLGAQSAPAWITAKFSIPVQKEKINVGGGVLAGTVIGESETGFGILYGVTTFGSRDKNLSLGFGWGYSSDGLSETPTISLGGMVRVSPRSYFITENYYMNFGGESVVLISGGGRAIVKNVGIDYGLLVPFIESGVDIAIPWLGLTVPFGNVVKRK